MHCLSRLLGIGLKFKIPSLWTYLFLHAATTTSARLVRCLLARLDDPTQLATPVWTIITLFLVENVSPAILLAVSLFRFYCWSS